VIESLVVAFKRGQWLCVYTHEISLYQIKKKMDDCSKLEAHQKHALHNEAFKRVKLPAQDLEG